MDVLFPVLPFAPFRTPAIGVSLLKAELVRRGISARVRYFTLDLAEDLGADLYTVLSGQGDIQGFPGLVPTESLVGEWFFAAAAFGTRPADDAEYLERFLSRDPRVRAFLPRILAQRPGADAFADACAEAIHRLKPRVVGFTSVFYQTCANLAVARRLKMLPDPPVIVLGGANCVGETGVQLSQSFPYLDYVCTGEGDEVFPLFLERLLAGQDARGIPGMVARGDAGCARAPLVRQLDDLPDPDYADYVERLRTSPLRRRIKPRLLIETSRGCWWGEKHHCTFCGLNAETMTFRAKSPDRVLSELTGLSTTYGIRDIDCVDNIMHMRYLQTLFPRLAETGLKLDLFYEVKANLRLDQLEVLRSAGITTIQAGVESFSDEVLGLMRKGCTGAQNIQLLRWCAEVGMSVVWSIIFGFPGESPSEYERMAKLVPLLTHLPRPTFANPLRLDRFSPNLTDAERLGFTAVRPAPAYRYIYPVEDAALTRLAYYFDFEYGDGRDPTAYTKALLREVRRWGDAWSLPPGQRPRLDFFQSDDVAMITDTRACARQPVHILRDLAKDAYVRCDVAHGASALAVMLDVPEPRVRRVLDALVRSRLMVELGGKYLSLAVFRTRVPATAEQGPPSQARQRAPRPRVRARTTATSA
jgi:ribosomal peptide maturation radical SAM protein 1